MQSGYEIVWSDEANNNLSRIIDYLETNWTDKELRKFFRKLEKTLQLISQYPQIFPVTHQHKNIHKCVLTKQTSIYYRFQNDKIFLITLFDNRQNPLKFKV